MKNIFNQWKLFRCGESVFFLFQWPSVHNWQNSQLLFCAIAVLWGFSSGLAYVYENSLLINQDCSNVVIQFFSLHTHKKKKKKKWCAFWYFRLHCLKHCCQVCCNCSEIACADPTWPKVVVSVLLCVLNSVCKQNFTHCVGGICMAREFGSHCTKQWKTVFVICHPFTM